MGLRHELSRNTRKNIGCDVEKTQQVMVEVRVLAGDVSASSQRSRYSLRVGDRHHGVGDSGFAGYQALKKELRDLPMHWI